MIVSEFEGDVTAAAPRLADPSDDWGTLHADPAYTVEISYRRTILHGAFSARLLSRMAGMCLLGQLAWVLDNTSSPVFGAVISLSGGALP